MKPRRVVRSRKKGARLPANTVCVSRPSPWGNPFVVKFGRPAAACVALFRTFVAKDPSVTARWMRENIGALRGRNLACWCPEGTECHADVLLELANRPADTWATATADEVTKDINDAYRTYAPRARP